MSPEAARGRPAWARALAYALSGLALVWVLALWWEHWPAVLESAGRARAGPLVLGLLLAVLSALCAFQAYLVLAWRMVPGNLSPGRLFNFYFVSQLLKHLPGRVWGIGYQAAYGRSEAGLKTWVGVNLAHMGAAAYWALACAFAILSSRFGAPMPFVVLALSALVFAAALALASRLGATRPFSRWRWSRELLAHAFRPVAFGGWFRVVAAFLAANLFQHLSWMAYGSALGIPGFDAMLSLSAAYMLAWFIGYAALLTPSGLGIRELSFAWLAGTQDPQLVAMMAVVGRASFLSVDVLLGGACLAPRLGPRAGG